MNIERLKDCKTGRIIYHLLIFNLLIIGCGYRLPDRPLSGSVDRIVLAELFTAVWCPNCPVALKSLAQLHDSIPNAMVLVAYHPTQDDPFGTVKTDARASFYGIPANPTVIIDGSEQLVGVQPYETYRDKILARRSLKSPIKIILNDSVSANQLSGNATVIVVDSLSGNFLFNLVVYEDSIAYHAINGETLHRYVVRDVYSEIPVSLVPNDTITKNFSYPIDTGWQIPKMGYTVFITHPETKEVIQCAYHNLRNPLYNFSLIVPETLKTAPLYNLTQFPFKLVNTGNNPDSLIIDIPDGINLPPLWSLSLCDTLNCYPRPHTIYCAQGDTVEGFEVSIGPTTPDTCFVTLKVSSKNNPGLIREQRLHIQTAK